MPAISRFHPLFAIFICLLLCACEETPPPVQEAELPPVPNQEYANIEEAIAAAGFHCPLPEQLPKGYSLKTIATIDDGIIQIIYHTQGKLKINYRVAQGQRDISGILGKFTEKTMLIDNAEVLARLHGLRIICATWQRDGLSFAALFDEPLKESIFIHFVESIPRLAEELEELPLAETAAAAGDADKTAP